MDIYTVDNEFKIYQPLFKNYTRGFEQQMIFAPTQIRFYHFYMPGAYLEKTVFNCVPDGCVDIIFIYNDTDYLVEFLGTPKSRKVCNPHPGYHYFGVRLKPGMFFTIDDVSLAEVTDKEIFYTSSDLKIDRFIERLLPLTALSDKIDLFLSEFSGQLTDCYLTDSVKYIISRVNATKGNIKVSQLATDLCYSERQINRVMKTDINMSPKTLTRIVRFQNALHNMISDPHRSILRCIQNLNYSDQSHFQREFKEFAGISPKEFMNYYYKKNGRMHIRA
jgi:AraC-like DNA-binding protein